MSIRDFIFSEKRVYRLRRHLFFLGVLAVLFYLQSLIGPNMYKTALMSLLCFFPLCIASVYICLDYFLPVFLQRKRYGRFAMGFVLMAMILFCVNCFTAIAFLQLAVDFPGYPKSSWNVVGLSFVNTSHALVIGGFAMGIKIAKNWYMQRKENLVLAKQRVITELQLEKARIYPRFLFQSLDKVHAGIKSGSSEASQSLLKISDLLSYMLYDGNDRAVALAKEISMIQHLVDIAKTSRTTQPDIRIAITGDMDNVYITPMIIFSLLENCLKEIDDKKAGTPSLYIHISVVQTHILNVRLVLSGMDDEGENISFWRNKLMNVRQRHELLFPGGLQFDIKEEKRSIEISMDIDIKTSTDEPKLDVEQETKHA